MTTTRHPNLFHPPFIVTQTDSSFSFLTDRTAAEIAREQDVDMGLLKDPQEDKDRVQGDPKWYVQSSNQNSLLLLFSVWLFAVAPPLSLPSVSQLLLYWIIFTNWFSNDTWLFLIIIMVFILLFSGWFLLVYALTWDVFLSLVLVIMADGSAHVTDHITTHQAVQEKGQHHWTSKFPHINYRVMAN